MGGDACFDEAVADEVGDGDPASHGIKVVQAVG